MARDANIWATLALRKGMSLAAVPKILGHDRLTATAIDLNLTDGHSHLRKNCGKNPARWRHESTHERGAR
jgi:hypothetical protein